MNNQEYIQPYKTTPRFFYGYIVVIFAFIIQVAMLGPRASYGVFFKPMLIEFSWTRALTSGAYSISLIMQGLSGIIMGGLNDRLGPRVVMTLCGLILGLGILLMSQINATWQLYLFYSVIIGVGMGGLIAPPFSTVTRWFVRRRSMMMGIVVAGGGAGMLTMPPFANWLLFTGWRNAYIILGAVVLVVTILAAQFLKRDPAQIGQTPYGENEIQAQGLNLVAQGFSLKEATYTWQFWTLVILLFCYGFAGATIMVHFVPYITDQGISAATAATVSATIGGAVIGGSMVLGVIASRIGNRKTCIISFFLLAAALFCLLIARDVWMFYLLAVVIGFAQGGITPLQSTLVAELFGIKSHGLILGICAFGLTLGAAVGPFVTGYIFDLTGSYQRSFLILGTIGTVGLILAIMLRPTKRLGGRI